MTKAELIEAMKDMPDDFIIIGKGQYDTFTVVDVELGIKNIILDLN